MLLGPLLFSLLSQAAPVAALVGTRIYPLRIPQEQPRPAITYQLISRVPEGSALCELDDDARVQVSLFADTYGEIEALSQAVRAVLHLNPAAPVHMSLDNEIDHHDDTADCYFRSQDYFLELPAA